MEKTYDPRATDLKWEKFWEENAFFRADPNSENLPFSLVMPPPNVTGILHMGHALVSTLQDILTRWKRMHGYETLWVPGTDHAGIATQMVVERHLLATTGKRRSDFTREEFIKHVWQWKEKSEKTILAQLKRLGCSCDWSRLRFTMDPEYNIAVRTIFKKLYDDGLIYRGYYLVNWDPITQTALADDEVEYEERDTFLWYFRYHIADEASYVVIATTRPETMLGDTAIAISPNDERYRDLVSKKILHPILKKKIPVIEDSHVDAGFGTGVVKITPAHDLNDYQIGLAHGLPMINVLTPDGRINENGGTKYQGMSREEAREAVVYEMKQMGLLDRVERHTHRVGVSYRSKAVIEPFLSKQWFVSMKPFAQILRDAVAQGKVKLIPKLWEQTYFYWVENVRDWCISRQLWWGHQIPIWYRIDNPEETICYAGAGIPPEVQKTPDEWVQDPDVLDTWFSSALWPFATLGWPEETQELRKFYPNSTLITGHDILFFWVARMILMGEYALKQVPFPEVFLHGLIYGRSYWTQDNSGALTYITGEERKNYDLGKQVPPNIHSKWEKLSKSKGNVIDPLEMIEEYGTDAVRMSLCSCANQSPQIDLDRRRFEEFKNFANKIWNGARFIMMNLENFENFAEGLDRKLLKLEDKWLLSSLNRLNQSINTHLEAYHFDQAALLAYDFFWKEFCSSYLESVKPVLFEKRGTPEEKRNKQKILIIALCNLIRLLHPIAPFITEELFQLLKARLPNLHSQVKDPYTRTTCTALSAASCAVAPYPEVIDPADISEEIEEAFAIVEKIVHTIRNIRGEMKIPPGTQVEVFLSGKPISDEEAMLVAALLRMEKVNLGPKPKVGFCATGAVADILISIPLPAELAEKEHSRLLKEKEKLLKNQERLQSLLADQNFLEKAKPELIEQQRQTLKKIELELTIIGQKLSQKYS